MRSQTNNFTDVADVILKVNGLGDHNTMQFFKKLILKNIIEDSVIQQIVNTYFECNLNTSQAAKELYMHRNTLINKLDQIKKTTNLDLQNFKQASTLYLLLNYQE
jgi:DNA-binding PucR family transcriptional regulator